MHMVEQVYMTVKRGGIIVEKQSLQPTTYNLYSMGQPILVNKRLHIQ